MAEKMQRNPLEITLPDLLTIQRNHIIDKLTRGTGCTFLITEKGGESDKSVKVQQHTWKSIKLNLLDITLADQLTCV